MRDQQEEDLQNHLITSEKDDKEKGDKDITTIIFMAFRLHLG